MNIYYSSIHRSHIPPAEIFNGQPEAHAEVPDRIENIYSEINKQMNVHVIEPEMIPKKVLTSVHAKDFVQYLHERETVESERYSYPSVFPYAEYTGKIIQPVAQRGTYCFDMYTPVNNRTYRTAKMSASLAAGAASSIIQGESVSYALCRPPGHHAEYSRMGGYCYFNNAAIAANVLLPFGKVAILDVDFHHGNGTQNIFYKRSDVCTISIHASPDIKFPFFSGWKDETGTGPGLGCNKNFPLPLGITDDEYQTVLLTACEKIQRFNPDFLIVALGLDTHADDPIGGFTLTTPYYQRMATTIRQLGLPTVIVQEGGYNTKKLGENVVSFLRGFDK